MPLVSRAADHDGYLRSDRAVWLAQRQEPPAKTEQGSRPTASMGIRAETVALGDAPLARARWNTLLWAAPDT